jgi:putative ABC transport system permease protein
MWFSVMSGAREIQLAVRRLSRSPSYSATVILSLAIGLAATGAMFALIHGILLQPLPYEQADRLVVVRHAASRVELPMVGLSPGLANYYAEQSTTLETLGAYTEAYATLTDRDVPERIRVASVTPNVLTLLRPAAVTGRIFSASDYEPGGESRVLLGLDLWRKRYGADPAIVGQTIEIDRNTYRVVGVLAPDFHFPSTEAQAWIAFGWSKRAASRASLQSLALGSLAKLKPGATLEDATRDLQRLVTNIPQVFPEVTRDRLDQMGLRVEVISLKEAIVGNVKLPLLLLQVSVGFLLLITWANATNIALVRAERSRRDIALSRALGAGNGPLLGRFFGEGFVLAGLGGAVGLGLAALLIAVHFGFPPDGIPRLREVGLTWPVVTLVGVLTILSSLLLAGIGFAATRRVGLMSALLAGNTRMSGGRREQRVRKVLVAAQVALALVLLIGSGLMASSFWHLKRAKLGFTPDSLVTFRLPIPPGEYSNYHASARVHDEILRRLRVVPGLTTVEAVHAPVFPLTSVPAGYEFRLTLPQSGAEEPESAPWGRLGFATPGYFQAMRIPIVKGRTFEWQDTGREGHGIILSASLAKALFGNTDPIGRHVRWAKKSSNPDYVVVGVVGDVPGEKITDGASRAFYFPHLYPPKADTITGIVHDYIPFDEMYVLSSRLPMRALMPIIQRTVREVDPKLAISRVVTLPQLVNESTARPRLTMFLLLAGALTAVLLGVIGIYGMLSYSVALRRSEFGIRMALGAAPSRVAMMVLREGAFQTAAGIGVGVLVTIMLTRYLRSLLYGVSAADPLAFVSMSLLLFTVGLAASYVPARLAARTDPVRALRSD